MEIWREDFHQKGKISAVQIIRIWKWKQKSDENLVILEFKYFQNKKW